MFGEGLTIEGMEVIGMLLRYLIGIKSKEMYLL
jgi:hypothetical protein